MYQRWGWSKDQTLLAFKKHPGCMCLTEERITKAMDFLVNRMGWPSEHISRNPIVLLFSLEKRTIPRCSVFSDLVIQGVVEERFGTIHYLKTKGERLLGELCDQISAKYPSTVGGLSRKVRSSGSRNWIRENV